eukprot:3689493-Pleurochrysis_carterae.AAC.1
MLTSALLHEASWLLLPVASLCGEFKNNCMCTRSASMFALMVDVALIMHATDADQPQSLRASMLIP